MRKLTPLHVRNLYAAKVQAGLKSSTINVIHATFHHALADAACWKLVSQNVCDQISPPTNKKHKAQTLTLAQAIHLLKVAQENPLEAFVTLALTTGMRHGEMSALRWSDIDFEDRSLKIERTVLNRNAQPSAAIMDAQSVKTVEESAGICGVDAHKCVKGRKRHILVESLGLLLSVYVTPADLHDSKGARCLLAGLSPLFPRLKKIWADAAYRGQELAQWCLVQGNWDLEVVERTPGMRGFSVLPKRWVVERTLNWISRNRRMSKDYERKVQTSETFIQVAMIRLLVARLGQRTSLMPKHT